MRRFYTVSITALQRQVVLVRMCSLALGLGVDILEVSVTPSTEDGPTAVALLVHAPEPVIDRFRRRVERLIEVVGIDIQEQKGDAPRHDLRDAAAPGGLRAAGGRRAPVERQLQLTRSTP